MVKHFSRMGTEWTNNSTLKMKLITRFQYCPCPNIFHTVQLLSYTFQRKLDGPRFSNPLTLHYSIQAVPWVWWIGYTMTLQPDLVNETGVWYSFNFGSSLVLLKELLSAFNVFHSNGFWAIHIRQIWNKIIIFHELKIFTKANSKQIESCLRYSDLKLKNLLPWDRFS